MSSGGFEPSTTASESSRKATRWSDGGTPGGLAGMRMGLEYTYADSGVCRSDYGEIPAPSREWLATAERKTCSYFDTYKTLRTNEITDGTRVEDEQQESTVDRRSVEPKRGKIKPSKVYDSMPGEESGRATVVRKEPHRRRDYGPRNCTRDKLEVFVSYKEQCGRGRDSARRKEKQRINMLLLGTASKRRIGRHRPRESHSQMCRVPTSFEPNADADADEADANEEGVNETKERLVGVAAAAQRGSTSAPAEPTLVEQAVRRDRKETVYLWAREFGRCDYWRVDVRKCVRREGKRAGWKDEASTHLGWDKPRPSHRSLHCSLKITPSIHNLLAGRPDIIAAARSAGGEGGARGLGAAVDRARGELPI
ncbi:hypothetical protein B0H13DRAFT_1905222 [Mycena leptocephala]|nr:hypothetical protein B0H13DRAFT_1905222 [Mycena leptocephala]